MKTRKAFNIPGHAHELTCSCYRRLPLLTRTRTRLWVINALDQMRSTCNVALLAYVIMPDHVHVIVKPRASEYAIEAVLKSFKLAVGKTAMSWLRRHQPDFLIRLAGEQAGDRTRYHFWQPGGGYDRNIVEPSTLERMIEYVHANPVRKGLSESPTDWLWSSARFWAGESDVPIKMDRDVL